MKMSHFFDRCTIHWKKTFCPSVFTLAALLWHRQIISASHDDVIKWKRFPRYWPFARGIHRSAVNSPHKGKWRGALMFSLICAWTNVWANHRDAGDLRRYRTHYDITVMNGIRTYHLMWVTIDNPGGTPKVCYQTELAMHPVTIFL